MQSRVIAIQPRPFIRRLILAHLTLAAVLAASMLYLSGLEAQERPSHVVVVNAANPVSSISVNRVARMFQKRITRWEGGNPVVLIDLPATSDVRRSFSRRVLHRTVMTVENFWRQQMWAGRDQRPLQLGSDDEVLAFVANHPDAIGYVSADAPLREGVKRLRIEDGS